MGPKNTPPQVQKPAAAYWFRIHFQSEKYSSETSE